MMMSMKLESQQEDIQLILYPVITAVIHLYRLVADINHTMNIKLSCCIPILQCGGSGVGGGGTEKASYRK